MHIGERLREERERLGFSQTSFASLGGASLRSQIEWEKARAFPNAQVLSAFAQAGADVQYILTGIRSASTPSARPLRPDQEALLDNLEHCSKEDQDAIRRMALMAARAAAVKDEKKSKKSA